MIFKNPLTCTKCNKEYSSWDNGYVCPYCSNDMSKSCEECNHADVIHTSDIFNKCRMFGCTCNLNPMGIVN